MVALMVDAEIVWEMMTQKDANHRIIEVRKDRQDHLLTKQKSRNQNLDKYLAEQSSSRIQRLL